MFQRVWYNSEDSRERENFDLERKEKLRLKVEEEGSRLEDIAGRGS